jgi:hypothetical protein
MQGQGSQTEGLGLEAASQTVSSAGYDERMIQEFEIRNLSKEVRELRGFIKEQDIAKEFTEYCEFNNRFMDHFVRCRTALFTSLKDIDAKILEGVEAIFRGKLRGDETAQEVRQVCKEKISYLAHLYVKKI